MFDGGKIVAPTTVEAGQGGKNALANRHKHTYAVREGNFLGDKERAWAWANPKSTFTPTMKLTGVKRVDSDKARIILNVTSDWGKGDGFEIWLDKDCEIENDYCDNGVDYQTVFGKSDIVIPEGATPEAGFLTAGQSAQMDIEPGTYDFLVMNPSPNEADKIYMVLASSDSHGDDDSRALTFPAAVQRWHASSGLRHA